MKKEYNVPLTRDGQATTEVPAHLTTAFGQEAAAFKNSLSIAGVDGTTARLKERLPGAGAIGKAWLKTGSLRDVASVAGYVQGDSGRLYTLVAVLNHPNAQQARPALDALLEWTVRDNGSVSAARK